MNYNLSQQKAIDATEENMIIRAPAGSGKTSTIVGAIQKYHEDNPKDKIVAITFTRKAAGELQERINTIGVEVSTIHSWAYRRLQSMGVEYGFTVSLLEDEVIKDILKQLCKLRRHYYINQFQLFSYVMGNYNIDVDDKLKRTFETIRSDYVKYKKKNGFYDFTDLPQYLYDKMRDYDERIVDIDALFVDEFQDVDLVQLDIFHLVDAKKKVYIGDAQQSIYQFRGALEEVFDELINRNGFQEYNLDTNYRSYQEIIDYANTVYDTAIENYVNDQVLMMCWVKNMRPSEIICERRTGGQIFVIDDLGDCVEIVSKRKCSDTLILQSLITAKDTQILCRGNKQVKKLQAQGIENVSTIHQAKGLEYTNVILVDFPIDCDEERNVAYVGMTRAKDKLCIVDFNVLMCIVCREEITTNKKLF